MGGGATLKILVDYDDTAKTEDAINFKIRQIEWGGIGGLGKNILNYENCEKTRNDLIAKLFSGRITPTSATNTNIGVSAYSSTGKQNIADTLVNKILTQENTDWFIGKVKEIANDPQKFIDKTKQSFDKIRTLVKNNMSEGDYDSITNILKNVIELAGSLATNVAIQNLDEFEKEVLEKLNNDKDKIRVTEIFEKTRNKIIQNKQKILNADPIEQERIIFETINGFSSNQKNKLPEQIKTILEIQSTDTIPKGPMSGEIKSTNKPTSTISTEPMSKDFKESFMIAMALKMFDENDDAEMVDNSSVGVMGNPGVDDSETFNYPRASEDLNRIIELVKELIKEEEYVYSFNGQHNIDNKNNNIQKIKKANEYINYLRELIHETFIPNSTNIDTDVNKIIKTAKEIIKERQRYINKDDEKNGTDTEENRQKNIKKLIDKLNSLITPRDVIPSTDTGYGPKIYPGNYSQPMNSQIINNYSLNKM